MLFARALVGLALVTATAHADRKEDVAALSATLDAIDPANPRSVDSARVAAEALGASNSPAAVAPLAKLAQRAPDKKLITAEVAAIRSLGLLTAARGDASTALRPIIAREVPPNGKDHASMDALGLHYAVVGAALNAAGALGDPGLVSTVLVALYRDQPLATQARRALTAFGTRSADAARDVLLGKQVDVERAFAKERFDRNCADGKCQANSAKEFYAAVVLGDLRDAKAVPELLSVLGHPALPSYYVDGEASPTTSHTAALNALREIGANPTAAKAVAAMWRATNRSIEDRAGAVAAYPYLVAAADPAAATELAKLALDNSANDELRIPAMVSAALLSADRTLVKSYSTLAKRYFDEAAKRQGIADKAAPGAAAGDAKYDAAKQKANDAKAHAMKVAADPKATVDQIRVATDAAKRATEELAAAKTTHREDGTLHRQSEADAKAYTGFGRMFQAQIGAIDLAVRCAADATCYADTLARDPDRITADVAGDIPDLAAWSADDKAALREATLQRALLELAHRGPASAQVVDAVLARLGDTARAVRQAALLALPHVAARPCAACTAKLDAAIKAAEGKVELGDFAIEATILRNYLVAP